MLQMKWDNVGVGRVQRPYVLRLSLRDAEGRVVGSADAKSDPRTWMPGVHELTEIWPLPATMPAGDYSLAVALIVPGSAVRPFRLAMGAVEQDGEYLVSRVRID